MDNETSEVAYTDNQWSVYLNLCKEYRQDKSAPTIKTSFRRESMQGKERTFTPEVEKSGTKITSVSITEGYNRWRGQYS